MSISPAPALASAVTPAGLITGLVAFIFAATGPVALVVAAFAKGGLGEAELASWLFGGFFLNGFLTIGFSLYYRQPLVFLWSIPGTVLVGNALTHLSYPEIVGAYLATGFLMLVLGLTGIVNRAMSAVPMPVVLAMVAGVFLQFGIEWVRSFSSAFWIAAPMTAVFFAAGLLPRLAQTVPPTVLALAVGVIASLVTGAINPGPAFEFSLAGPRLVTPQFSWGAMAELVVPLAITVLVAQNAPGFAVLRQVGHEPPVDNIATACGVGAIATSFVGTVSSCLAGAITGIMVTGEKPERQWVSGVTVGVLGMLFGIAAPMIARLSLAAPRGMIAALAGLAMLRVLQTAFVGAFKGPYGMSALIAFLITVSGITIFNIGAPFWGILFGALAARTIDAEKTAA